MRQRSSAEPHDDPDTLPPRDPVAGRSDPMSGSLVPAAARCLVLHG